MTLSKSPNYIIKTIEPQLDMLSISLRGIKPQIIIPLSTIHNYEIPANYFTYLIMFSKYPYGGYAHNL